MGSRPETVQEGEPNRRLDMAMAQSDNPPQGVEMKPEIAFAAGEFARSAALRHGRVQVDGLDDHDLPASFADPVLPAVVFIEYRSSDGHESARTVTLRSVWTTRGVLYVSGVCHLRNALRTFRVDRISELVCMATGEVAADPAVWLKDHAQFEGEVPKAQTSRALAACRDELAVLAFIANADGYFDPDEVEIALDLVVMGSRFDIDRTQAARYIRRLPHACHDLEEIVGRLIQSGERWDRLQRSIRRLVDADRAWPIEEQLAVDEVLQAHGVALASLRALATGASV